MAARNWMGVDRPRAGPDDFLALQQQSPDRSKTSVVGHGAREWKSQLTVVLGDVAKDPAGGMPCDNPDVDMGIKLPGYG